MYLSRTPVLHVALFLCLGGGLLDARTASACGCFAPPDPSVPVVQAGERILFAKEDGDVITHIQIQYQGKPADFGWLLPLPAVPKNSKGQDGIDLGVEELFTQLTQTTQPKYRLGYQIDMCANGQFPPLAGAAPTSAPSEGPLVARDSAGPYDFAILKADSKDAVFQWLRDNRFFVPAGTDEAAAPYVRPGAYFLALKLRAGQATQDLQPVVLRYRSDLPLIPIVLTSVAAVPDMGIQVWMLGAGRAIPRNYFHTVINDAKIDWFSAGRNYNKVVIAATREAEGRHSFVTEYAGTSALMRGKLDAPGRFSDAYLASLRGAADPVTFIQRVLMPGQFSRPANPGLPGPFAPSIDGQVLTILSRHVPLPQALATAGATLASYYRDISRYLLVDRKADPAKYADIEAALAAFSSVAATAELKERVVDPTLAAAALFGRHAYLTRLYTTLSPAEMNRDPVFSYNASLPDYSNIHQATLTYHCDGSATLKTESGWYIGVDRAGGVRQLSLPFSQRIEVLRDTGGPEVVTDNTSAIASIAGQPPLFPAVPGIPGVMPESGMAAVSRGCSAGPSAARPTSANFVLLLAGLLALRRWRPSASRRL